MYRPLSALYGLLTCPQSLEAVQPVHAGIARPQALQGHEQIQHAPQLTPVGFHGVRFHGICFQGICFYAICFYTIHFAALPPDSSSDCRGAFGVLSLPLHHHQWLQRSSRRLRGGLHPGTQCFILAARQRMQNSIDGSIGQPTGARAIGIPGPTRYRQKPVLTQVLPERTMQHAFGRSLVARFPHRGKRMHSRQAAQCFGRTEPRCIGRPAQQPMQLHKR